MSLLKAYNKTSKSRDYVEIKHDFLNVISDIEDATKQVVIDLVQLYAEFATAYMVEISQTLTEPKGASETMKFMNSYIAEVITGAGLHYYNQEHGFSVVDKSVQYALENEGMIDEVTIAKFIDEIEDSYVEVILAEEE